MRFAHLPCLGYERKSPSPVLQGSSSLSKETRSTIRESWLKKAGTPSKFGIALNITTTTDKKFKLNDYQIRGVVDVLSGPQNDDERMALARILLSHADIPDRSKRRFQLIAWERIEGGEGVKVQQCREFPIITTKDIIPGSFQKFEAPAYEEPRQEELPGDLEHTSWQREYQANPYCRFESRKRTASAMARYQREYADTYTFRTPYVIKRLSLAQPVSACS